MKAAELELELLILQTASHREFQFKIRQSCAHTTHSIVECLQLIQESLTLLSRLDKGRSYAGL